MALRALKTEEEIAGIPLDQPILVELPGGLTEETPDPKETKAKPEIDPDAKSLQKQLEAAQAAQASERARAEKAEREASARAQEADTERKKRAALEGDVINGGLSAAQSERDAAKVALQAAGEAGDWKAIADAQSRIGRAEAKILSFESGAAEIAERTEIEKRTVVHQPVDPMVALESRSDLYASEKTWLKDHPDAWGARNNELGVGYQRAMQKGLVRGTDAYFDYLNEFMGYKSKTEEDRSTSVQAPPSRNERDSSGRPSNSRVTLSPEERDTAKSLGISEIDYAKQKVRFEEARRADPDKYR
jgi:multidrug efflux pump subunit AcrA (membrane-fusion protein)